MSTNNLWEIPSDTRLERLIEGTRRSTGSLTHIAKVAISRIQGSRREHVKTVTQSVQEPLDQSDHVHEDIAHENRSYPWAHRPIREYVQGAQVSLVQTYSEDINERDCAIADEIAARLTRGGKQREPIIPKDKPLSTLTMEELGYFHDANLLNARIQDAARLIANRALIGECHLSLSLN